MRGGTTPPLGVDTPRQGSLTHLEQAGGIDVTNIELSVTLDTVLWDGVEAVAERSGRSRDQVIRDSVRRDLAGTALAAVLAKVRGRDEQTADEALQLAADEKAAARAHSRSAAVAVARAAGWVTELGPARLVLDASVLVAAAISSGVSPNHSRVHMHFTPTSSSWLNLVERWFRELTDKALRRGVFRSAPCPT